MVEIDDLEFCYDGGEFGLRIDSFRIAAGETVALIGPSGCGKTTLMNLLAGIAIPQQGTIRIDGRELTLLNDTARRAYRISTVGMVFQEFELLDYLNVKENILLPFFLNSAQKLPSPSQADVDELTESLGLASLTSRSIDRLSHGERQRVAIGRALITKPPLLLADEPTGNLDPRTRDQIVDLLFQHATDRQTTLIMATHDYSLTERFDVVIDFSDPAPSHVTLLPLPDHQASPPSEPVA